LKFSTPPSALKLAMLGIAENYVYLWITEEHFPFYFVKPEGHNLLAPAGK
jgi:hypothetical protein